MIWVIIERWDLIIMNVNRIDQSQKRLNYYSRSSPKKKKNTYYQHSPLITSTTNSIRNNKKSHHTSLPSQQDSSFRTDNHQSIFNKIKEQILIEQCNSQEILIDDPVSQQSVDTRAITDIKSQINHFNQKSIGQSPDKPAQIVSNEMRIQDNDDLEDEDNEKQVSHFNLQQPNKDNKDAYIKIQNQQQQTMNRQFTFADNPIYWIQHDLLPIPHEQEQYLQEDISQKLQKDDQFHSDLPYFQSNMEYQVAESMKKSATAIRSPITQLFETQEEDSPRFNAVSLRRMEDKWITSQDYDLLSPKKNNQILIEQSKPQTQSLSVAMRPYGNSIMLLNDIVCQIPPQLGKTYDGMYNKLIVDQVNIEQQLKQQEQKINIMKMLIDLRRYGLKCQDYLLSASTDVEQQLEINRVLIHSLIKQINLKKSK